MNRTAYICREYLENPCITQRGLAAKLSLSLGSINKEVLAAVNKNYLVRCENTCKITESGLEFLKEFKVDCAVIAAAGFGSRFVPLTYDTPKGLLKVFGEPMIERQIKQLHEAGIYDITIVVGYLKEKFDYLQDKYNVKLLFNPEYTTKNTLATVWHARELFYGKNTYLLASDNWLKENIYHAYEPGAWYACSYTDLETGEWCLGIDKKGYIEHVSIGGNSSYFMYGPAYLSREFSEVFIPELECYYKKAETNDFYWEQVVYDMINYPKAFSRRLPPFFANKQPDGQTYEFENLEELRHFDVSYRTNSDNKALSVISEVFNVSENNIKEIRCLKAGMTNNSFLFSIEGIHYICRIPGAGTEALINRSEEYDSYQAVKPLNISDDVIYIDSKSGYKISKYYKNSKNADASDNADMEKCMEVLRKLHQSGVKVNHSFNISDKIEYYEKLCYGTGDMIFEDYMEVKANMLKITAKLNTLNRTSVLAHVDAIADNFIFLPETALPKLIDWEYAGMADPLIDIAMCCIYSYYSQKQSDRLLEMYLGRKPVSEEIYILYSYMALGGFLWSIWTVYKTKQGDFFGEYSLKMYRYAKDYYAILKQNLFVE